MSRFLAFIAGLVILALACGMATSSIANSVSNGLAEMANIEMAQAMQAQAHATQLATAAGLAGQIIVAFTMLAGVMIGGILMFIGARLLVFSHHQAVLPGAHQAAALEDRRMIQTTIIEQEPEDLIFANWR